mgnify:CR=1 FL=1
MWNVYLYRLVQGSAGKQPGNGVLLWYMLNTSCCCLGFDMRSRTCCMIC